METLAGGAPPPIIDELAAMPAAERSAALARTTPITHGDLTTFVHLGEADRIEVRRFMANEAGSRS